MLLGFQLRQQAAKRRVSRADDDDVAELDRLIEFADQQARKMRQMLHGEAAVAANQARDLQIAVEDSQLKSLADQPFCQLDQRALAQIKRVREAQRIHKI